MDKKTALKWLTQTGERMGWTALAIEIGLPYSIVYKWHERRSVPQWRLAAVEQALERLARKDA